MPEVLDGNALLRWSARAAAELRQQAGEINLINVFPVADADTGSNMALTMAAAAEAAARAAADGAGLAEVAAAMSHASLMSARGNSGLILSQLLAGFADTLTGRSTAGPGELARCLQHAADLGYAAVAEPVEGTILSVAGAAAAAARTAAPPGSASGGSDIGEVAFAAARGAASELARTPLRLDVLARAGVVDAGGRGLLAVLAALVHALTRRLPRLPAAPVVAMDAGTAVAIRETGSDSYGYEVSCLLRAAPGTLPALPALRRRLRAAGDSVVIAGHGRLWRVHVHVNDADQAIEAARLIGEPLQVNVSQLITVPGQSGR